VEFRRPVYRRLGEMFAGCKEMNNSYGEREVV
jgi:hypothetical protein